jgi:ArsR family transcriptional regulator
MLKAAARRLRGVANVELIRADLASLPLPDHRCDAAILLLVLTYVEDPAAVLAEARRVLRPRGKLVAVDLLAHDRDAFRRQMGQRRAGFTAADLHRLADEAGFSGVDCAPLPPEPQAQGPALLLMSAQA